MTTHIDNEYSDEDDVFAIATDNEDFVIIADAVEGFLDNHEDNYHEMSDEDRAKAQHFMLRLRMINTRFQNKLAWIENNQ